MLKVICKWTSNKIYKYFFLFPIFFYLKKKTNLCISIRTVIYSKSIKYLAMWFATYKTGNGGSLIDGCCTMSIQILVPHSMDCICLRFLVSQQLTDFNFLRAFIAAKGYYSLRPMRLAYSCAYLANFAPRC